MGGEIFNWVYPANQPAARLGFSDVIGEASAPTRTESGCPPAISTPKPANNEYMPVETSAAASSNAIIDNSVKTVNQNNQNQNLGISSRNDDVTIRLSDAAA